MSKMPVVTLISFRITFVFLSVSYYLFCSYLPFFFFIFGMSTFVLGQIPELFDNCIARH